MSTDNNNNGSESKQPLRLSKPGKLELRKTVDAGQVKQSFSHGRSKTVVVEKKMRVAGERDKPQHGRQRLHGKGPGRNSCCCGVRPGVETAGRSP